jgi:hypothetical protein
LLQDIVHIPQLSLIFRRQDKFGFLKQNIRSAALKIKPLADLFDSLINSVCYLGAVYLGNDIKGILLGHLFGFQVASLQRSITSIASM